MPPAEADEASRDSAAAAGAQARALDQPATHRKRRLLAAQRLVSQDRDWSLPETRASRTLARPLDTEDPYAP